MGWGADTGWTARRWHPGSLLRVSVSEAGDSQAGNVLLRDDEEWGGRLRNLT